ncbi:MAG: hypothetical protein AAFO57_09575 [Pseudomonadota bacterium]
MRTRRFTAFIAVSTLALAACGSAATGPNLPEGAFWEAFAPLCGNAYLGGMTTTYSADRDWKNSRLILHVEDCAQDGVKANFNITEDRTRTWTFTPGEDGNINLRIGRAEGTGPGIESYGGVSTEGADAMIQIFPIDEESRAAFEEKRIMLSTQNVWTLGFADEGAAFIYHVQRIASERGMRFDLSTPVPVETPEDWEPPA